MAIKPNAPVNELSIDVDAALASARAELTPEVDTTSNADADTSDEPTDDVGDELDAADADDNDQADDDEGHDDESGEGDDDAGSVLDIKANGKVHKVDLNNKDEVRRLLSFGLGAKSAFSQLAKTRQQVKQLTTQISQATSWKDKAGLWDKLESIKSDENKLFKAITGQDLDAFVKAKVDKTRAYEDASPAERAQIDSDERTAMLQRELDRLRREQQVEKEEADRRNAEAEQKETYAVAYPEFQAVFKKLGIKDSVQSQETATDLWELGMARVARAIKKHEEAQALNPLLPDFELTKEFFQKQFAAVAKQWGYQVKEQTRKEVSKVLERKSKDATKKAAVAATRNYKKRPSLKGLDGLSPSKIHEKLFG